MTPNANQYLLLVKTILQKEGTLCALSDLRTQRSLIIPACTYVLVHNLGLSLHTCYLHLVVFHPTTDVDNQSTTAHTDAVHHLMLLNLKQISELS